MGHVQRNVSSFKLPARTALTKVLDSITRDLKYYVVNATMARNRTYGHSEWSRM